MHTYIRDYLHTKAGYTFAGVPYSIDLTELMPICLCRTNFLAARMPIQPFEKGHDTTHFPLCSLPQRLLWIFFYDLAVAISKSLSISLDTLEKGSIDYLLLPFYPYTTNMFVSCISVKGRLSVSLMKLLIPLIVKLGRSITGCIRILLLYVEHPLSASHLSGTQQ